VSKAAQEKFVMDTLTKEQCTAPAGKFRLVCRDHMDGGAESVLDDIAPLEAAKVEAQRVRGPSVTVGTYEKTIYVFDDNGAVVHEEG